MPTLPWTITLLTRSLDDDAVRVAEPLLFPEVATVAAAGPRARRAALALAKRVLETAPAIGLHHRGLPSAATLDRAHVTLDPPQRRPDWADPVALSFAVVRWRHGEATELARVPAVGITVVARRGDDVPMLVADHILAALRRTGAAASLFALALAQRDGRPRLRQTTLAVRHRTAKQAARADDADAAVKRKPVIRSVGTVLGDAPPAYETAQAVARLADVLGGRTPRSVLLVGPSGVGKTAIVHELARTRALAAPVWSTSGSRLIAGAAGFGAWQERCGRLCKEAARDGAVLHVGNLVELMQVGRVGGSQGIAGYLKTPLGRGDVLVVAECTPEQLAVVERLDPHLLELFQRVPIDEPDGPTVRRILRAVADAPNKPASEVRRRPGSCATPKSHPTPPSPPPLTDADLDAVDRLHRRYATYSAAPSRPVRFVRDLLRDHTTAVGPTEVIAAFARETGLPLALLDPAVPMDRTAVRAEFAAQLIGQDRAVDLVADVLATVKAALGRPKRPIASLLFAGPTGVGKTEMAKALAGHLFGDRGRLARFDMSEFATPAAVERLVGGGYGRPDGLLTARVREQPFAVVLFDEFEKAQPAFFDLLLQVLGDGRLTDAAGRVADFTNAIVVMTSNLGAESFGRGAFGLNRTGTGAADHFTDAVRDFVRPELFNRIDRVVPFLPLDAAAIAAIADRELTLVERRDGFRLRGLHLSVTADARRLLADRGYDVRYGARPLRRAVERQLLGPLADAVNRYPAGQRLEAEATVRDGDVSVAVRATVDDAGRVASAAASASPAAAVATACGILRRDVQRLVACPPVLAATNLLFQLDRDQKRADALALARAKANRAPRPKPVYDARAERIRLLRLLLDAVAALAADADAAEDLALAAVYGDRPEDGQPAAQLPDLERRLRSLLLELLARQVARPHSVVLGVFGTPAVVVPLATAYVAAAEAAGFAVNLWWYEIVNRAAFARHAADDPAKLLAAPPAALAGVALRIAGPFARLHFAAEKGVHAVTRDGKATGCVVDASVKPLADYAPPGVETWPTDLAGVTPRRAYDPVAGTAADAVLGKTLRWAGRGLGPVVAMGIERQLDRAARAVLGT